MALQMGALGWHAPPLKHSRFFFSSSLVVLALTVPLLQFPPRWMSVAGIGLVTGVFRGGVHGCTRAWSVRDVQRLVVLLTKTRHGARQRVEVDQGSRLPNVLGRFQEAIEAGAHHLTKLTEPKTKGDPESVKKLAGMPPPSPVVDRARRTEETIRKHF